MNYNVCCFNDRLLILFEAPPHYKFSKKTVNRLTLRQTVNLYPNFIQNISLELESLYKHYNIICILYKRESLMMNTFPNGVQNNITYYIYYTDLYDCEIDNVFYDELLSHLIKNVKMTTYVAQVFLQALRNGFNKPDKRINNLIQQYDIKTHHDNLEEIKHLILNLRADQKHKIENIVSKNSTFNSILPNMLLLNVTNCIQQESLSIKHSDASKNENIQITSTQSIDDDIEEDDSFNTINTKNFMDDQDKFISYNNNCIKFKQHFYYCSYGDVVIVEARMQMSTFNNLMLKNIIMAFLIDENIGVDQIHVFLYVAAKHFHQFSKIRIHGKILQYIIRSNYTLNPNKIQINYNIDFNERKIFSTAPIVIQNVKLSKESFKPKIKVLQIYLVVCKAKLHIILKRYNCICKIIRIITSPFNKCNIFFHIIVYINDYDTDFLYVFLPEIGMDDNPCLCNGYEYTLNDKLPHSQKLWLTRPCIEILFHTHFDWTLLKINNDFLRKQTATDIFKLYDIFESGKTKHAKLLNSKVFKVTIENLTTFKFYNETGLLYPFESSGHEELYIYTLIKMMRIIYRCIVLPLTKLDTLTPKNLTPSKYILTSAFIDDPLTPTTSARGPQSTRNLKSIESNERLFDTKVINVTMLMNSFNLCGSEDIENKIKF